MLILDSTCYDGATRLSNGGQGYLNDGRSFSIGRPEICTDGDYIPVCGDIDDREIITFCGSTTYNRFGILVYSSIVLPTCCIYRCYTISNIW